MSFARHSQKAIPLCLVTIFFMANTLRAEIGEKSSLSQNIINQLQVSNKQLNNSASNQSDVFEQTSGLAKKTPIKPKSKSSVAKLLPAKYHQSSPRRQSSLNKSTESTLVDRRTILFQLSKLGRENTEDHLDTSSRKTLKSQLWDGGAHPRSRFAKSKNLVSSRRQIKNKEPGLVDLEEIDDYDKYVSLSNVELSAKSPFSQTESKMEKKRKQDKMTNTRGFSQIKSIYNALNDGNLIYGDKQINTVRLIPSIKVDSSKKVYFLFNLSSLSSTEKLIKSEVYINRKYIRQRLVFDLHYFLYSTLKKSNGSSSSSKNSGSSTGAASVTIDLSNFKSAKSTKANMWQAFNIAESINSYLAVRNNRQTPAPYNKTTYYTLDDSAPGGSEPSDELVLIMESTSTWSARKWDKALPDSINPYLLIYSNEDETVMKKFFQSRVASALEPGAAEQPPTVPKPGDELSRLQVFESQVDKMNEISSGEAAESSKPADIIASVLLTRKSKPRNGTATKRPPPSHSTVKSKLHESIADYYKFLSGGANATRAANQTFQEIEFVFENAAANNASTSKKTRREAKKPSGLKRRMTPSFEEIYEDEDDGLEKIDEKKFESKFDAQPKTAENKCGKQAITIDFGDISFSDWILEPKSFQSNYCLGVCKFPLNQKLAYSNYATLQSILNSLNLNTKNNPPELCCSPSVTDSLPILYIDKNSIDYVVKLLPSMIVRDCSCR